MSQKTLYLIDVSGLIFRAFFAIPELSTKSGYPTNATYGFLNMLLKIIEKQKPDGLICVYDSKEPSFRKEIYAEYKSNRGAPPEKLQPQFDDILESVRLLGLQSLKRPGFEADDLIGTLAHYYKDCKIVIVSSDKDLMQLVTDRVSMYDSMKEVFYTPKEVKEKLGVTPAQVVDYLALVGDSSDNIPGVPGIGPKTAASLIEQYGTLEKIIEASHSEKGKKFEAIREHEKMIPVAKKLASVLLDIPVDHEVPTEFHPLQMSEIPDAFMDFLKKLELFSLAKKFLNGNSGASAAPQSQIEISATSENLVLVEGEKEFERLLGAIQKSEEIFFNQKNSELRVMPGASKEIFSLSETGFLKSHGRQFFSQCMPQEKPKTWIAYGLKDVLKQAKAFQGDFSDSLLKKGSQWFFDPLIACYVLSPEDKKSLTLETMSELQDLYSSTKSDIETQGFAELFWNLEMPLTHVLASMEYEGVRVDKKILTDLSIEYEKEMSSLQEKIFRLSHEEFNLNSPKQLAEVLFEKLKLPVIRKTKTGFSTDAETLEKLALLHEVPMMIVRFRELSKLKSTYVDVLPGLVAEDGRIHAKFNQTVTATGRLSSSDPNLQNIPIKTESGRKIRRAFVAENGATFVGADYSQVELRLVAHMSGDPALIEAFQRSKDVHVLTAAEIFSCTPEEVKPAQRSIAKAINFGLIYGKTAFGLSQELNISRSDAAEYIERYFKRYSGVKKFMDGCLEEARKNSEVRTLFGRRRKIPDIHSKNMAVRTNAERMAMNAPVQGTAADIMKMAMLETHARLRDEGRILLQVHDELVLECKKEKSQACLKNLKEAMETAVQLKVPLDVNDGTADNWFDLG